MGNGGHTVGSIVAPADADSIIACGAVDGNGILAGFSSIGPTYDGRIKPELVARGASTYAALPSPHKTDGYSYLPGTSFSTPLVAGCAALVLQAHPDWTPMEVREVLMTTASRANNPNTYYGWGIVDCLKAINGETEDPIIPEEFDLVQNYPNPFNSHTNIRFRIPDVGSPLRTTLTIFNILGQEVKTLVDDVRDAGSYRVSWNGRNTQGTRVASGVYLYRIVAKGMFQGDRDDFTTTKRMLLLK
jgi:subtilisin family serine protease